LLLLGLTACGDDHPAAPPPAVAPKKPAPVAKPSVEPAAPAYVYAYNPTGKRDPFRSVFADSDSQKLQAGPCDEPLCQYDLGQLTLVAVVTGDANPVAMVEDSQGRGFIVRRNSRMGRQGGRVTQILRDSITIMEKFQAPDGKLVSNPVSLAVRTDAMSETPLDLTSGKPYVGAGESHAEEGPR
jgi:type IV pilus assembly protein PilP